ncbi:FAD synthase [Candidatus Parcubacteria bacterium]|nr:MAG: FAD synthase [Candidatus Parcubacteria bacterium]
MARVLVFGVFDGIHPGHRSMLREAKSYGDYLIVALAPDKVVRRLKGRLPRRSFAERKKDLLALGEVDEVLAGDDSLGSWKVLDRARPDVVALGYDQRRLSLSLREYLGGAAVPRVVMLSAYKPHRCHSSLLAKENAARETRRR